MVQGFQLFGRFALLAVLLVSTAQGQAACNLCTSGAPFCRCQTSTSCPTSIGAGVTQCLAQIAAFKIHVTCASGTVQLSHQAATSDGSFFRAYVMSAANEALYNTCPATTFSFFTTGSFQNSITCTNGATPTNNYLTNDLYLIYECQNNGFSCPVFYDFSSSCVGGATTTATVTTVAGGTTTPMTTTTAAPTTQPSCCTFCGNGFWCPVIGGIGSCNIAGASCTCGSGGSCSTSAASCATRCPTTTSTTTTTTTTTTAPATTAPAGSAPCFHEDTVITYKGVDLKLSELEKHPECAIPHIVTNNGVRIETADGHVVRLTGDHLVFTSTGLVPASDLKIGALLFTSLAGDDNDGNKHTTRVKRITTEHNQRYFGLNCLESIVLANGIRTSTFGRYHTIPSSWMSFIGRILGVRRASAVGDTVAQLLAKLGAL